MINIGAPDTDGNALDRLHFAYSFAHDFLNLAALAGRLLWCEGVTPDMSRSPDLALIGVDAETYLVLLMSACETLSRAFDHFRVPQHRKVRKDRSYHKLLPWIENDDHWFLQLKDIRDGIVHRGLDLCIYTDRVLLEVLLMPAGVVELQQLHGGYKQEDYQEDKPRFERLALLWLLKRTTKSVLEMADQLC